MDKGVVVDIGNDIEGFVPLSQLSTTGKPVNSPADVVYETMKLDMRVLEVDPIHRRIVLGGDEHSGGSAAASGDAVEDHPDGVGARHGLSAGGPLLGGRRVDSRAVPGLNSKRLGLSVEAL